MFRETSPQRSIFGAEFRLDPIKRGRLERSWAHAFRTHALALIDEQRFAHLFHDSLGRPNKSLRTILGVLILKEIFDLTDDEALAHLEWDLSWHYALDITPEEAHACQKTLHNTRVRLLHEEGVALFESMTARLIDAAGIRTTRQRQDSTHVIPNIKLLSRLGLFVDTITAFLKKLRKKHPRLCARLPQELRERYLDREGYFADARGSEAPRRLGQAALDVHTLIRRFDAHGVVSRMESFGLLRRLYADQCVPPKADTPDEIELVERPAASSLQSPSDPDVAYGHKGKGYEVQLTETCHEDNPFEVATSVSVHAANQSDQHQLTPALDQIERTCGAAPEQMFADAGYGSGPNIVAARARGTDLQSPIGSKGPDEEKPRLPFFDFDATGERVRTCPSGRRPIKHQDRQGGAVKLAYFSDAECKGCPMRADCAAKLRRGGKRVLRFRPQDVAVARRREEQDTPAFKKRYKIRSGIEATNSEMKRCHGLGRLRVRRRSRVSLAVCLKTIALNVKRYVRAVVSSLVAPAPACACA